MLASMTIATWILAIATTAIAVEGGTALLQWTNRLRPGRTRRELEQLRREVALLHHAAWIDVATAGQGSRTDVDEKVRTMLMLDGWRPDMDLAEQAGYFNLDRLRGGIPGVTDT
jgi:hypothetical protein